MFSKPTVFIIGAGASHEVGFPLGQELTRRVADVMNVKSSPLLKSMGLLALKDDQLPYLRAAVRLHATLPTFDSIDEALHWLSDDPVAIELGKIGIAYEIIKAEKASKLYHSDDRAALTEVEQTWLPSFFSMILSGLRRTDALQIARTLAIINFNYDRSLEQYLFWALQERAAMDDSQALELVNSIKIIRPYGGLGKLWDGTSRFGDDSASPVEASKRLLTFTEQQNDETRLQILNVMSSAAVIVFLGFGFHRQNIEALAIEGVSEPRRIFGTVKGIFHQNYTQLMIRLKEATLTRSEMEVNLVDQTAREFLDNLKPSIIAAAN